MLTPRGQAALCSLFLSLVLVAAGCGPRIAPLGSPQPSREALAREVLAALERRDVARLTTLALSEEEFRDHAWPHLPASRPERNLPFSYVWGDLRRKSDASLAATLAEHGGKRFELKAVRSRGETTAYEDFIVERRTELTVVDERGVESQVQLFGSIFAKDGRFKVFSYVVD